jgi:hypothetical protein
MSQQAEWRSHHEGIDIAGALIKYWTASQQRSRRPRASYSVVRKGASTGRQHSHGKMTSLRDFFRQASDSAAAPTFVERLMQRCLLRNGRNLTQEGDESAQVNGAPLKRRAERIDSVSRANSSRQMVKRQKDPSPKVRRTRQESVPSPESAA